MLIPNIDIRIKNEAGAILFFDYVVEGEIVSTWQELTNTAKFKLPRKVSQLNDKITDLIQVGNEVVIRLGYDCEFVEEFSGFVTNISSKIPVEIECQDLMWRLKQTERSVSLKNASLAELVKKIVPADIKTNVTGGFNIGDIRYSKLSISQILDELKKSGITSYVRNGVLNVGNAYPIDWRENEKYNVHYHFQKNIIENDLNFKTKKNVKVKLELSSRQPNGKEIKYFYPENIVGDSELHTFHQQENLTKSDLKKIAVEYYNQFMFDGFRGSFLTFGFPYCDHGYVANLEDDFYPEKNGDYLIDKVVVRFGRNGYKREPTLGGKV